MLYLILSLHKYCGIKIKNKMQTFPCVVSLVDLVSVANPLFGLLL